MLNKTHSKIYISTFHNQRALTAKVCHQMAEHAVLRQRNYDAAIQHYKEALTFDANDEVNSKVNFLQISGNHLPI